MKNNELWCVCEACCLCVVGGKTICHQRSNRNSNWLKNNRCRFKITVLSEWDIIKITYVGTLSLTCKLTGTRRCDLRFSMSYRSYSGNCMKPTKRYPFGLTTAFVRDMYLLEKMLVPVFNERLASLEVEKVPTYLPRVVT